MKNGYFSIIVIFFLSFTVGKSEIIFNKAKTFQINCSLSYSTAGSLFNLDGKHKPDYLDTIPARNQPSPDSIKMDEIRGMFDLKRYSFNIGVMYSITNNLNCFLAIPISYYTMLDQYEPTLNSTGEKFPRYDLSVFQADYYLIGSRFRLDSGKISPIISAAVSLPQTFKNGVQNNLADSMQMYNSYQIFLSGAGHYQFTTSWLEAEATIALRTGDFSDEFIGRLEGGFSSIPNTAIRGFVIWTQSLNNFDKAIPVYQRQTTLQENCLDVGAGFYANVINRISLDISYSIRLGLRNTLGWGSFIVNMGYRL